MLYLLNILSTIVFADYYSQYYHSQPQQPVYQSSYYDKRYSSPHSSFYSQPQVKLSDAEMLNAKIEVLNEIRDAVYKSHDMCLSRTECRGMDTQIFASVRSRHQRDTHLSGFFTDFEQQLSKAYNAPAATEWDVYNSLSTEAKHQYQLGVRINNPKTVVSKWMRPASYQGQKTHQRERSAPQFNLDDLKMYILQQVETTHQSCGNREACLQSDNRIIDSIVQLLGQDDPMRNDLAQLKDTINSRLKQSFDTQEFVEIYYDSLVDKIPFLYRDKERVEWAKLAKTFKVGHSRNPQILNQVQIEEDAKPENELRNHVKNTTKQAGKKAVDDLFGAVLGGKGNHKDLGLFGKLFGR